MAETAIGGTATADLDEPLTPEAKKTILGATVGFFVDMYDVYLPVVALTPALIYFQPKHLAPTIATTLFYVVFAVTLVGRPIGAFIFGHLGDRIGRRRTTLIAVTGFGVVTLLIAFLPGYPTLGMTALILLILLRLVDGIFLGGEYTAASPLAMEYCPKAKRGFYSAVIQAGYPAAYVVISLFTALMLYLTPVKGGVNSPYVQFGWRVPFVVGALIAFGFALWFRRVPESRSWLESDKTENPIGTLFSGESRKAFLQVFLVMSGFWLSLNATISTLPQVLTKTAGMSSTTVTQVLLIANVVLVGGYLFFGVIGQRLGRRPTLMLLGVLITFVSTSAYVLLVQIATARSNIAETIALATIVTVLTVSGWGLMSAYINERFRIGIRASGFGIGYSLAVVLPAFYSFVMLWLAAFMPYKYTQIPLLAVGGLLILVGAALGPETKHVDMAHPERSADSGSQRLPTNPAEGRRPIISG
ncbi:MAG: MHS family MFS transporter [Chloroflexi bacterium]|nr:MAG: MHS family MFS transporter [Chloroflexota bacterium]TME18196.1 MAG: MHS family MFS transporter [Chloroflexota bacterium]